MFNYDIVPIIIDDKLNNLLENREIINQTY